MIESRVMPSESSQPSMTVRLMAFTLALWLGGAGCLLCCEMIVEASPLAGSSVTVEEGFACPTYSAGLDCCQTPEAESDNASFGMLPQTTTEPSCCALTRQTADPARKPRFGDATSLAMVPGRLWPVANVSSHIKLSLVRQHVPDRGSTYLRCSVFLI